MLRQSDLKFFDKARQVAEIYDFARVHIGCVAV